MNCRNDSELLEESPESLCATLLRSNGLTRRCGGLGSWGLVFRVLVFGLWEELGSRFRGLRVKGLRVWDLGFKGEVFEVVYSAPEQTPKTLCES